MSQSRKIDPIQNFRRSNKAAKSRQFKQRVHTARKQVFLTDTQTSDYTKSSGEMRIMKIDQLQSALRDLQRQNQQLRQTVISLKSSQYYHFNQDKLKELIRQNQKIKEDQIQLKKELEQSLIQRDFLVRFNKNLKNQCEALMKEILSLKNPHLSQISQSRKLQKTSLTINNEQTEELQRNYRRSVSSQVLLVRKRREKERQKQKDREIQKIKKSRQTQPNSNISGRHMSRNSQSSLNSDYFHGSSGINILNKTKNNKQTGL